MNRAIELDCVRVCDREVVLLGGEQHAVRTDLGEPTTRRQHHRPANMHQDGVSMADEKPKISTVAKAHSFGRYRVTKTLGAGAMGEVFEAIDDVLGREVAIKTLRSESGVAARFIDDRFRNEARAIAQFSHPGVVQVFDIDLTADPPYLVMERVSGPALSQRIEAGPLPSAEIAPLGIQIARALAAAHAAGVVHRDVKPSNILGAGATSWKLADFGVAHVPDSSLTMTGQFVGSPAYAAPEALVKGVSAAPGDVYGLGATLYEAATGTWPRKQAHGAILAPVPALAQTATYLPAHVAAAIDRAVSIESDKRPTASELADLLAGVARADTPAPVAASRTPHTPRTLRWQPIAIVAAILLVVILAIALRGDKKSPVEAAKGGATGSPANALPEWCDVDSRMVRPPPNLTNKSAKDWEKIVDKIYDQEFDKALRELAKFEERYGPREETTCVRAQLENLPAELREPEQHD